MKRLLIIVTAFVLSLSASAQYIFTPVVDLKATPVKNQASTGTCWCFATTSFIEAELLRIGKGEIILSEMFTVRNNYIERAADNYLRQGKGNLNQGSLAHNAIKVMEKYGVIPESAYLGINYNSKTHSHGEMSKFLKAIENIAVETKHRSPEYYKLQKALFDIYLGEVPESFIYNGKEYTAQSFKEYLGLNFCDYVEITSFTHHPFYEKVNVEVPDNWDHEKFYNLPLDEMMAVIDYSLKNGYTVAWDGDISNEGYVFAKELSIVPQDQKLTKQDIIDSKSIVPEMTVTQDIRQQWFESFITVDNHLEHITGISTDQNGTVYYKTKNSWGLKRNGTGYHYMSDNYVRANTISILVHKDAIPKDIRKKLGIK